MVRLRFHDILKDIHSAGVVHNDIRGDNLLTKDDSVAIIDFHLASISDSVRERWEDVQALREVLGEGRSE